MKITGNTVGTTTPRSDWNQADPKKADFIRNKPDIVLSVNNLKPDETGNVEVNQYYEGENISISEDGKISVLTADSAYSDNTRPITSAAVATQIGNIEILLNTI